MPGGQAGAKPKSNAELARLVGELADLMALDGGDAHRVAHYRRAATVIRRFHHSLAEIIAAGTDLTRVPGIGKGLAGFLGSLVRDGASPLLEDYRARIPPGVLSLMRVDGVGATRARTLRDAGVDTVAKLERALANREIHGLHGFGPGVAGRIRRSLAARSALAGRWLLSQADRVVERLVNSLRDAGFAVRIAGDISRRTEIVATADIVCDGEPGALRDHVVRHFGPVLADKRGDNPVHVTIDGVTIRLVAAPRALLGPVAHHLTGPPAYLDALGARARRKGLQLTPTGIASDGSTTATGERSIYERLGLPWVPPELREDARTIERAEAGLPPLVTGGDITGDLHMHTTWSDGAATLPRMVEAAADMGYRYVAVTDHSPSTGVVTGLNAEALRAQAAEIARVQEDFPGIRILRGCEVDVLPDGSLDIDDEILSELDVVLASVHSVFDMTEARMTDRIIRAIENPLVHILCHPTGRKLGRRSPYPVDLPEILDAARALNVAVEVNGNPRRLDLDHRGLWLCGELGVSVVVSSDAHSVARLDNMRYGVDQARRGWLQRNQIANTGTLAQVLQWISRRRV